MEKEPYWWMRGPRIHCRKYQDERLHAMYYAYSKTKAQCNFRNEKFELLPEEYFALWNEHWEKRGRKNDSYCMTRLDDTKPWNKENAVVVCRNEQLVKNGMNRAKGK